MGGKAGKGRRTGRVRMEEVARLAGVSTITVSRALRSPDKVSAETLRQVKAAVAASGYVPDLVAGSLASNRSRIIAAIVPSIAASIFADTVEGMGEELRDAGYQLLLGNSGYSIAEEEALVAAFLGRRPDGMMLTGIVHSEPAREMLKQAGLPIVESWDLPDRPIDMAAGFSNRSAGRAMTESLIRAGYRRIAFLSGAIEREHRASERRAGYIEAMQAAKLVPLALADIARPTEMRSGAEAIAGLLAREPELDAAFFTNDLLAFGALTECRRRNIAVPGRVAIAGFGDYEIAAMAEPALTTVAIPARDIGRAAARMLLDRLAGRAVEPAIRDLGFRVIRRASA
jgi:LacI family transcriptional regulator, gluconate utilization system Gnt-I transcriptional repressor